MAVPKKRRSHSKSRIRRSSYYGYRLPEVRFCNESKTYEPLFTYCRSLNLASKRSSSRDDIESDRDE